MQTQTQVQMEQSLPTGAKGNPLGQAGDIPLPSVLRASGLTNQEKYKAT